MTDRLVDECQSARVVGDGGQWRCRGNGERGGVDGVEDVLRHLQQSESVVDPCAAPAETVGDLVERHPVFVDGTDCGDGLLNRAQLAAM